MRAILKLLVFVLFFVSTALGDGRYLQVDLLRSGLRDSSGNSLASGKVYIYAAGTSTAVSLYQDAEGAVAHSNPLILDSRGVAAAWGMGAYKFVIKNSADVTQYTWDNLYYEKPADNSIYCGTSTGSSNAYAAAPSPAITSYVDGDIFTFIANHSTSGAATLNISGLGAKSFVKVDGSTALGVGDITSGQIVDARYVGSSDHFRLVSQSGVLGISSGGTGGATASAARSSLGLSSMATQASSSVSITGGAIQGIIDLAVADGGTGASTAADARTNLGLGTIATQNANAISCTGTLDMTTAPSYPDVGFSYTPTRTLNPAAATAATCADVINTLIRDLEDLGILNP